MAADKALVEGAYNIAKAETESMKQGLQGKQNIISSLQEGITTFGTGIELEGQRYDQYAQKVIDEAGMLSQEEASLLYDRLQEGRKDFIWGS